MKPLLITHDRSRITPVAEGKSEMETTGRRWLAVLLATGTVLASACGGGTQPAPTETSAPAPSPQASPPAAASPVQVAPSAPSPSPSPSPVADGESYTIEAGDTLATVAERFYGDPTLWRRIYD